MVTTLLALFLLPGCAGFGEWSRARGRDLGDCVRGSVGFGVGLYAEAQATSLLHPSVGFGDVSLTPKQTLRWDPRPLPPGRVRTAAFPTLLIGWPVYRHELKSMGYSGSAAGWRGFVSPFILAGNQHVEGRSNSLLGLHRWFPNPLLGTEPEETLEARLVRQSWFALSGTAGVIQVDFGVNPLEIVDFLVGIFGWDLLGDDRRSLPAEPPLPSFDTPAPDPPPPE